MRSINSRRHAGLKQKADPFAPQLAATGCPACGQTTMELWLRAPDRFHGRTEIYQLVRCRSCSFVWLDAPPPPHELWRAYGHDYDQALSRSGDDPSRWRSRCKTLMKYKSGGELLDIGCSSGGFLAAIKAPSWNLFGIEMSAATAARAKEHSGAQVFVGGVLEASFEPASFDAITCFHVLEHLERPREVLARVASWLKPDGVFYTMMPNIDSAGARVFGSFWYALELPRHLFHYSPQSLRYLADSVGFATLAMTTHRELFIEQSLKYLLDEAQRRIGLTPCPLAKAPPPTLPWRAARKALRVSTAPLVGVLAHLLGDGESIHALFVRKESQAAPMPTPTRASAR